MAAGTGRPNLHMNTLIAVLEMHKAHSAKLPQDYRAENNAHHWQRASGVKNKTAAQFRRAVHVLVMHSHSEICAMRLRPSLATQSNRVVNLQPPAESGQS